MRIKDQEDELTNPTTLEPNQKFFSHLRPFCERTLRRIQYKQKLHLTCAYDQHIGGILLQYFLVSFSYRRKKYDSSMANLRSSLGPMVPVKF
jgi:hypothetical protein